MPLLPLIYPFPDHRLDALTEPGVLPILPTVLVCLLVHQSALLVGRTLRDPEGAKGSLGLRNTHGLSCRVCVAGVCLGNASEIQ